MRRMPQRYLLVVICLLLNGAGYAAVLNVPVDYKTIQKALNAASDGDEIVVQPGRYVENIHFLGKNVILRSTDPENLSVVESTIIDGNQAGSVVTFVGTETAACVLRGFTITNGWAVHGGGINGRNGQEFGTSTSAAIESNFIHHNTAGSETEPVYGSGGGIHGCRGRIVGNIIADNDSLEAEICTWDDDFGWECEYYGGDGGGLWVCVGLIEDNVIIGNGASGAGGALWGCGGTIRRNAILFNLNYLSILEECDGLLEDNVISGNWTGPEYGALYNCKGRILNNIVVRNAGNGLQSSGQNGRVEGNFVAQNGGYQIYGCTNVHANAVLGSQGFSGLISGCESVRNNVIAYNESYLPGATFIVSTCQDVINNTVAFNSAGRGAVHTCRGLIANNVLYGNTANRGSGGINESPEHFSSYIANIVNNVVWGNTGAVPDQVYESAIPIYSCIENDTSGEPTNISLDPGFVDAEHGDFSLRPDSPCIDAGTYVPEAALDIVGRARGFDGSPEPRGDGSDFDIGAYEFVMRIIGEGEGEGEGEGGPPTGPHSADRDGDWRIAMSELLRVIQFYNAHGYHCDAATEDGYAPGEEDSLDAEEPWEFVNPLEVKRSPLVEAYMQKYGIKLPEIPEEHIKLWRAWVTRQHGISPQRHRGHGEEGAEDASQFSEDEVRSTGFSLAEVGTGTSPPRSAGSLVPVPGKAEDSLKAGLQTEEDSPKAGLQTEEDSPKAGLQTEEDSPKAGLRAEEDSINAGLQTREDSLKAGLRTGGCTYLSADYAPQDWAISVTELLRVIQFYNAGAYHRCDYGEDGFCPSTA